MKFMFIMEISCCFKKCCSCVLCGYCGEVVSSKLVWIVEVFVFLQVFILFVFGNVRKTYKILSKFYRNWHIGVLDWELSVLVVVAT